MEHTAIEYIIKKYGDGRLQPTESGWTDNLLCRSTDFASQGFLLILLYSHTLRRGLADAPPRHEPRLFTGIQRLPVAPPAISELRLWRRTQRLPHAPDQIAYQLRKCILRQVRESSLAGERAG